MAKRELTIAPKFQGVLGPGAIDRLKAAMDRVWARATHRPVGAPEIDYDGFPEWLPLLVTPMREAVAAERLRSVNVHVYLPQILHQVRAGRGISRFRAVQRAMMPGLLFVPASLIAFEWRDEVLDWAGARIARLRGEIPRVLTKAEIEELRLAEGRANRRNHRKQALDRPVLPGESVMLLETLFPALASAMGMGIVLAVASGGRIDVEFEHSLLGRQTIQLDAADVVVMKSADRT